MRKLKLASTQFGLSTKDLHIFSVFVTNIASFRTCSAGGQIRGFEPRILIADIAREQVAKCSQIAGL
jgi:hypothetical protein